MIGFDVGTYNLVCCKRDKDNNFAYKREVNAFIEVPLDNRFVFNMMKKAGVPLIEKKESGTAYALGEAAVSIAYTMNQMELKRPMKDGCLNPKEKHAQQIMNIMIHSMIGDLKEDGETLVYCVPANAVNEETDATYHLKILEAMFKAFEDETGKKVKLQSINEALALVYAELESKQWTGIGISCLVPGTKIYTKNGIKNIEDVQIGDEVITHKGRFRKVNNIITKNFSGNCTHLQLQGYSNHAEDYKFVDNHELYVKRNGKWQWTGCEELLEGDIVGEPIMSEDRENSGQIGMTFCERKTSSEKVEKVRYEVSADVQRLIGYFLGDGSVNLAEGCVQWDFASHEKENIEDVIEILKKNFGKSASETFKSENCVRVKCYSKGMTQYFNNNFYDQNREKKYPWSLERLSRSHCLNLLAGLIRSDGTTGDSVAFENTNTKLIILAKQLFSRLGYPASISYNEPREYNIEGRTGLAKKIYWRVSVGTKLVKESLASIIDRINCDNSVHVERLFIEDNYCCSKIQKIEQSQYDGIVYDLQVEEDHSFSGPFLTIHNCGAGMVNVCYAKFGNPLFTFSIVNSGDWIDKMAAKATGESSTFINKEKEKLDLTVAPNSLVMSALRTQYEIMMEHTIAELKKGLEAAGSNVRSEKPIDIVIAGGTASPKGFEQLFKEHLDKANLPIEIGSVIKPKDPLFSVARGCLIAAENS